MTDGLSGVAIRGIVPPMATPLAGPDELDIPGLGKLIEHILQGGVDGLFILGTTGEGPALSYKLRRELIQRTCRQVAGRVPVLVGVSDSAHAEIVQITEHSAASGANAVVVAPPFYFPLSQSDLLRLVEDLAARSPLPVYLYNRPELTKISFSPETVQRASVIPNVAGLKDSSGDMQYLKQVLERFATFPGSAFWLARSICCMRRSSACLRLRRGADTRPRHRQRAHELHRVALRRRRRTGDDWIPGCATYARQGHRSFRGGLFAGRSLVDFRRKLSSPLNGKAST